MKENAFGHRIRALALELCNLAFDGAKIGLELLGLAGQKARCLRGTIGAIAGGGYVLATKGKDVEVPAKSRMKLKLDQSLNIPVSAVGSVSTNTGGH